MCIVCLRLIEIAHCPDTQQIVVTMEQTAKLCADLNDAIAGERHPRKSNHLGGGKTNNVGPRVGGYRYV